MLRERDALLREPELFARDDFAAPPLLARLVAVLRAPDADERLAPELDDLAREPDVLAPPLDRFALDERALRDEPLLDRLALERELVDLRAPPDDEEEEDPELPLAVPSIDHLPDITRCAASATASAISEPSLVALETTLLAARSAVSAASSPASRILRRADGLALIAAAAAARPAASISLLIAALASLSTVESCEPEELREEEDLEELLRADFAIA